MRPVVHTTKHYRQITLSTATTGTRNSEVLASAVQSTTANLSTEIEEGALVKAIYIELWMIGSVSDQFFTVILDKVTGGASAATFTQLTDLFTYPNKKNVLYTTQGLASNDGIAAPIPIIRQWFKIPKGKQRFGLGDTLILSIASRGSATLTYCGFAIYKEVT